MRKLGVSIYPEHSTINRDKEYLDLAHRYGFERVFTCLLSVQRPKEELMQEFKEIIGHAKSLQMEFILDVAPAIFQQLNISYDDLSFFAELGADGVRLDLGFDGLKESKMTYNPYGLKIELNMSNDVDYLPNILTHQANKDLLLGCHNFYPQKFTGLPYHFFISCSKRFKEQGIRTAAFVTSQHGKIGPWDINDGLCTLEQHRYLPIDVQAKHLWATHVIDDVIIGNAYASAEELARLGSLRRNALELKVEFLPNTTLLEKTVALQEAHLRRGDISEYMIRSVEVRKKYAQHSFPRRKSTSQARGDIFIGNDTFGKYKGELQVILQEMPPDERKNLIARVVEEEHFLLDYIQPWGTFFLVAVEGKVTQC
ncbi:DUF871 domain-containing protein [Thermoflavimicrobium daqui]|uniref:DUF871 domain-containing protein n=1 Tax=Thermoflavimicrobium daqui TaxID=2137476 RepID=A0A364K447_9BACL|nr:MupG family TIM beta-alpha barrel fold protein [Thermoflavimicrobium daqui]RAL24135.1 DUF871 domain-containing protein [Thermoflavimicrobium daqui]